MVTAPAPRSVVHSTGTLRPLLRLAWPVLVEQVLVMLVGFSDTLLAGHYLGRSHLAAMMLMSYVLWLLTNAFAFVAIGATAMTARFVGAGDYKSANRVANQSYVLGALLALGITVGGLLFGEQFVSLMQLEGEAADLSTRYLRFILPVVPAMMVEAVGIACLRGAGDMVSGLVTMSLVNVTNTALSWVLLLGPGPIPEMGWDSLAIGTACGHLVGGLIPLVLLLRGRAGLKLEAAELRPDRQLIRRILRIGVPGGIDVMTVVGCQMFFVGLINGLGELAAAAHGVAIRIESLAYLPGSAFQVAAATLAGQYLGARQYRQAGRSVLMACLAGGGLMLTAGIVLYVGSDHLARLFLSAEQADVAAAAAPLLRIVSVAMLPLALMMILSGALRGAGDTRWPLVFTLIGFVGVRMPLAWLLAYSMGWGVQGAWYAMAADIIVRCLLVMYRFWHGGWKRTEV